MRRKLVWLLAISFALTSAVNGMSASSIDDIKAKLGAKKSEIDEVDKLLSDEDRNARIAAMELLLESGNPIFVSRAKEVGLFSSEIEFRTSALKAIFQGGGPLLIKLQLNGDGEKNGGISWLKNQKGDWTPDGKTGQYSFSLSPFDEEAKCWKFLANGNCAIYLTGDTISLRGWSDASGSLTLGGDGKLIGTFVPGGGKPIPAEIDLSK
jgi:hypothetical protein